MTRKNDTLSTIKTVPISYFVYSALSYFGSRRGGALPGTWFIRALGEARRDAAAVRQTLYRMEHDGELTTRKVGRVKLYAATRFATAEIDAGSAKIFAERRDDWDGNWTIVTLLLSGPAHRIERERVVALLAVEGFAHAGGDTYVHPRNAGERVLDALSAASRRRVIVVRGRPAAGTDEGALTTLWPLDELASRYRRVSTKLADISRRVRSGTTDRDAFLFRFAVVFEYLGVAWEDPELPVSLLPKPWTGESARREAARLYETLLPGALRFADRLLADTTNEIPEMMTK
jgi:phenylacetic acid degradation operon negative regulatory protein